MKRNIYIYIYIESIYKGLFIDHVSLEPLGLHLLFSPLVRSSTAGGQTRLPLELSCQTIKWGTWFRASETNPMNDVNHTPAKLFWQLFLAWGQVTFSTFGLVWNKRPRLIHWFIIIIPLLPRFKWQFEVIYTILYPIFRHIAPYVTHYIYPIIYPICSWYWGEAWRIQHPSRGAPRIIPISN